MHLTLLQYSPVQTDFQTTTSTSFSFEQPLVVMSEANCYCYQWLFMGLNPSSQTAISPNRKEARQPLDQKYQKLPWICQSNLSVATATWDVYSSLAEGPGRKKRLIKVKGPLRPLCSALVCLVTVAAVTLLCDDLQRAVKISNLICRCVEFGIQCVLIAIPFQIWTNHLQFYFQICCFHRRHKRSSVCVTQATLLFFHPPVKKIIWILFFYSGLIHSLAHKHTDSVLREGKITHSRPLNACMCLCVA